jgi:hypothetical protein
MPSGGGLANCGQYSGAGARRTVQVCGVKAGDGSLDARRQIVRDVVEQL